MVRIKGNIAQPIIGKGINVSIPIWCELRKTFFKSELNPLYYVSIPIWCELREQQAIEYGLTEMMFQFQYGAN